ncbi:MAG: TrkA family potassium uptake protein [Actinomycetaceae bacterium]|nr:TrkA family potassium uptake protein [Actinomycetaceae bacterium]
MASSVDNIPEGSVLVVGLGRFGTALASTLDKLDRDILILENNPALVEKFSHRFHVIQADATNIEALAQAGAAEFSSAVVSVGSNIESSVLITANLSEFNIPQIWAKAISRSHGRILRKIGAHHVVFPEYDAGSRVAHMVFGKMLDYIDMEDGFSVVKMKPPRSIQGFTLDEVKLQERYGVRVIGIKSPNRPFEYAHSGSHIAPDDILIVSGDGTELENFARAR